MDEITPMWSSIQQTVRQAKQHLDDDSSDWTKDQQNEIESSIADVEQMLEVVSETRLLCMHYGTT